MSSKSKRKMKSSNEGWFMNIVTNMYNYLNNQIQTMNTSKIFAGVMIIIINVSSKFVTLKLSKTVESYLKYTFSRDILVFAISWMGTRDIYVALSITIIFIIFIDFLLNENSTLCILPESFTDYHIDKLDVDSHTITPDDIKKIKEICSKLENDVKNDKITSNTSPIFSINQM
jgi:hypothetical protein